MVPFLISKERKLYVRQTAFQDNVLATGILTADAAAAASTLTVRTILGFAINQNILIGEWGQENSELVKTHASTAPSGTTITLTAGIARAHSAGTKIYVLPYNQVELSHASTLTGSKSVLTTADLQADQETLVYNETAQTSGFYFARFKEAIGGTFSSYCDGVPYGGFATNTVGYAIDYALRRNKLPGFDHEITYQFCLEEINACLKNITGKQVHYPQLQTFNYVLGQATRGSHVFTLPTDIYDNDTNKSILAVRVGDGQNLTYKDPEEWEHDILEDTKYTQVTTQATSGATTLEIDNSYDFADSGSVHVYVSGTKHTVTYTGVTRSATAGVLTGVPASGTGSITVTIAVDTYVWQDEEEGTPAYFTIRGGSLEIWPLPDGENDNQNVYLDYYTGATEVDTDSDTLDTERADMVKFWLIWAIRAMKKNDGRRDLNDADYQLYKESLNDMIRTKRSGTKHKFSPKLNRISYS